MPQPKRPSQRELTLAHMRIAGYDDDRATFTRLLVDGSARISYAAAKEAFALGRKMREAGIPRSMK